MASVINCVDLKTYRLQIPCYLYTPTIVFIYKKRKMKTRLSIILLIFSIYSTVNAQKLLLDNTYSEQISLNLKDSTFIDTIVVFQNLNNNSNTRRILVNKQKKINLKIVENTWNSKYIHQYLKYQDELNKFAFFSYEEINKEKTIAHFYLCDKKTMQTVEVMRFKLVNNNITEINPLPCCQNIYITTSEYDNPQLDIIDCIIINKY